MQNVSKSIRLITQKAHGTCNGTIIDMATEICKVIERFNHRLTKLENSQCQESTKEGSASENTEANGAPIHVHEVPTEVQDKPVVDKVSKPPVSESTDKKLPRTGKTKAGKTGAHKK